MLRYGFLVQRSAIHAGTVSRNGAINVTSYFVQIPALTSNSISLESSYMCYPAADYYLDPVFNAQRVFIKRFSRYRSKSTEHTQYTFSNAWQPRISSQYGK